MYGDCQQGTAQIETPIKGEAQALRRKTCKLFKASPFLVSSADQNRCHIYKS